jgi:peptidoglycan/LPS O-acetylase OafA/YrhL
VAFAVILLAKIVAGILVAVWAFKNWEYVSAGLVVCFWGGLILAVALYAIGELGPLPL